MPSAQRTKNRKARQLGQEMGKGTSQTQPPVSPRRTGYEVGRRIREMRGFHMTQAELAERIGHQPRTKE